MAWKQLQHEFMSVLECQAACRLGWAPAVLLSPTQWHAVLLPCLPQVLGPTCTSSLSLMLLKSKHSYSCCLCCCRSGLWCSQAMAAKNKAYSGRRSCC